jgi:hypothetical protein
MYVPKPEVNKPDAPIHLEYDVRKIRALADSEGFQELRKFMNVFNRSSVKKLLNKDLEKMQDIGFYRGLVKAHERIFDIVTSGKVPGKNE